MFNENKYFVDKLRNLTPHFREGKKKGWLFSFNGKLHMHYSTYKAITYKGRKCQLR